MGRDLAIEMTKALVDASNLKTIVPFTEWLTKNSSD
jgi:hypothetical protein